ncbi:MAG TPA: hypothetical protein VHV82_11220 [Sporichthyaceae bacterium]|jgi:CubicO group peptidase (beta-lactamase class C family)|nr:hypothetical protein [Sporichthyaceae bacterium]
MPAVDNRRRPPRQRDLLLIGPYALGHIGFGGTVGFADPTHGLVSGYTMNSMSARR